VATRITQQSRQSKDESTFYPSQGPLLSATRPKPQKDKTGHQDLDTMEAFIFPIKKAQQVSQMYHVRKSVVETEITKQNQNLLSRMLKIEIEPMRNTINLIPKTIPSNK
jgi:hypothetical protein